MSEPEGFIPTWNVLSFFFRLSVHTRGYKTHPFLPTPPPQLVSPRLYPFFLFLGCSHLIEISSHPRSSVSHTRPDQTRTAGTAQCKAGVCEPLRSLFLNSLIRGFAPSDHS